MNSFLVLVLTVAFFFWCRRLERRARTLQQSLMEVIEIASELHKYIEGTVHELENEVKGGGSGMDVKTHVKYYGEQLLDAQWKWKKLHDVLNDDK